MEAPLLQQTRYSDIDGSHVPWRQICKYRCRCTIRLLSRDRVDYRLWSLKPAILKNLFAKSFQGYIIENFIPRKFLAI